MPRSLRVEQFSADEVCTVFVTQRCVRRAWLAGNDPVSGKDYSFRKEWIRRRLEALSSVFAVDVLTYAILSNHMHQILRNRPDIAADWTDEQVAIRWLKIFPGRRIEEQLAETTDVNVQQLCSDKKRIALLRSRLSDISWFMKALAEPIARIANQQDECTGRFWEGRFKAQQITDEAGLLACSVYVDLNPVRAHIAASPDDSLFTSAYDRIKSKRGAKIQSSACDLKVITAKEAGDARKNTPAAELKREQQRKRKSPTGRKVLRDAWLAPLTLDESLRSANKQAHVDGLRCSDRGFLRMSVEDYLRLLRLTSIREAAANGKPVPPRLAELLRQHGVEPTMWKDLVWNWRKYFGRSTCAGGSESMKAHATRVGRHHHSGQQLATQCFL